MAVRVIIEWKAMYPGACITLAPTAFQWRNGDFLQPEVLGLITVDEDTLSEIAIACSTHAIVLEDVIESEPD